MDAKHTQGPWIQADCSVYALVTHGKAKVNRFFLNVMSARQPFEADEVECLANARLIAAAPELLEAAQQCVAALALISPTSGAHLPIGLFRAIKAAREAAAKATGSAF